MQRREGAAAVMVTAPEWGTAATTDHSSAAADRHSDIITTAMLECASRRITRPTIPVTAGVTCERRTGRNCGGFMCAGIDTGYIRIGGRERPRYAVFTGVG